MEQKVSEENGLLNLNGKRLEQGILLSIILRRNMKKLVHFLPLNQKFVLEVILPQQVNECFTTLLKLSWNSTQNSLVCITVLKNMEYSGWSSNVLVHSVCDLTLLFTVCPQNVPSLPPKKDRVLPGEITIIMSAFFKSSAVQVFVSCTFLWPDFWFNFWITLILSPSKLI